MKPKVCGGKNSNTFVEQKVLWISEQKDYEMKQFMGPNLFFHFFFFMWKFSNFHVLAYYVICAKIWQSKFFNFRLWSFSVQYSYKKNVWPKYFRNTNLGLIRRMIDIYEATFSRTNYLDLKYFLTRIFFIKNIFGIFIKEYHW